MRPARYTGVVKIYSTSFAPNPRRVRIFCAEKHIDIEEVRLDMLKGEHRSEAFRAEKNPLGLLPVLELDDGRVLTESLAICEYLESCYPEPPLFGGADPWQRALTREATRIAELGVLQGAAQAFQHTQPFFADRVRQNEAAIAEGRERFALHIQRLDQMLADRTWLAGSDFSVADITLLCAIDFGKVGGCAIPEGLARIDDWLGRIRERPSCQIRRRK